MFGWPTWQKINHSQIKAFLCNFLFNLIQEVGIRVFQGWQFPKFSHLACEYIKPAGNHSGLDKQSRSKASNVLSDSAAVLGELERLKTATYITRDLGVRDIGIF